MVALLAGVRTKEGHSPFKTGEVSLFFYHFLFRNGKRQALSEECLLNGNVGVPTLFALNRLAGSLDIPAGSFNCVAGLKGENDPDKQEGYNLFHRHDTSSHASELPKP